MLAHRCGFGGFSNKEIDCLNSTSGGIATITGDFQAGSRCFAVPQPCGSVLPILLYGVVPVKCSG